MNKELKKNRGDNISGRFYDYSRVDGTREMI